MRSERLAALLRLEAQRVGPLMLRYWGVTAGVVVLFIIAGKGSAENVLAVLAGTSIAAALPVPLTVSRDRWEKNLYFLTRLPVTPDELVTARFITAALAVLPHALFTAIAFTMLQGQIPGAGVVTGGGIAGAALVFWLLLCLASWCLIAALASADLGRMMNWPLIALVTFVLLLPAAIRRFGPADPGAVFLEVMVRPWFPLAVAAAAAGLIAGAGAASFVLARRSFATVRSDVLTRV